MTKEECSEVTGHPLVLYDGVCGFCNRAIQLLLRLDNRSILRFAPLQSAIGKELLGPLLIPSDSRGIVLLVSAHTSYAKIYQGSDAVIEILHQLPTRWSILGRLLKMMPFGLREGCYRMVACNRYRIFGKFVECPLPTEEQRSRILGI